MDAKLKELKNTLRALVVSSPTQIDVRTLLRDYRNMMGVPLPLAKYGYREPLPFLKDCCSDCFLGSSTNPVLTLIVPDTLKHIDNFVQKQKVSSSNKFKGKRRSVPESIINTPSNGPTVKSFQEAIEYNNVDHTRTTGEKAPDKETNTNRPDKENDCHKHVTLNSSSDALYNFYKKRLPHYNSSQHLDTEKSCSDKESYKEEYDSGRQTSSSKSSLKCAQLEELRSEILELIADCPDGIWCTDLMRNYRERYNRELNFTRFGYTSIISAVYAMEAHGVRVSRPTDTGDWLLCAATHPGLPTDLPPGPVAVPPRLRVRTRPPQLRALPVDVDDALPGIDFDPDVFPEDCMHFLESIPALPLTGLQPGAMLEVVVGEVYSPSHFWLIRLGEEYNIAMENIMDEMTRYYSTGEGKDRFLARGAVRIGHYCSSVYERDWHRSLIIKIIDSDTVKVRHVDYGTVDTVSTAALRPLRRAWSRLPAQGLRARLAGLRPSAAGRRWPHAACAHFLRLVREKRLVANVVALDAEEDTVEAFLIDTSTSEDVCVAGEMISSGHADPRADSALRTSECYLYPMFEALENGDTPNYAEIYGYLRDGIALEYVEAYRRHVPSCLPTAPPSVYSPAPVPQAPPVPANPHPPDPSVTSPPLARASSSPAQIAHAASGVTGTGRSASVDLSSDAERPSVRTPTQSVHFMNRVPMMLPEKTAASIGPAPAPAPVSSVPVYEPSQHDTSQASAARLPPAHLPHSPFPPVCLPSSPFPLMPLSGYACYPPCPPMYAPSPLAGVYAPPPFAGGYAPLPRFSSALPSRFSGALPFDAPRSPPPPYNGERAAARGEVRLSVSECEVYGLLSAMDPAAAHWYMVSTIERAMAGGSERPHSTLNVAAPEFRSAASGFRSSATDTAKQYAEACVCRPPPGFDG